MIICHIFILIDSCDTCVSFSWAHMVELSCYGFFRSRASDYLSRYLTSQNASFELVSRIMKFVDYKLQSLDLKINTYPLNPFKGRRPSLHRARCLVVSCGFLFRKLSMVTFDPSLISSTLQTELFVGQRSRFLERLPIFKLCGAPGQASKRPLLHFFIDFHGFSTIFIAFRWFSHVLLAPPP